jgi:hypothetical protein
MEGALPLWNGVTSFPRYSFSFQECFPPWIHLYHRFTLQMKPTKPKVELAYYCL